VNHRFAELSVRLPKSLAMLENRVRDRVQERLSRGKITVAVSMDGDDGELGNLKIDEMVARRYADVLKELKTKLGLAGELDLTTFVTLPDVLTWERNELDEEAGWKMLEVPLNRALEDLLAMKRREGSFSART